MYLVVVDCGTTNSRAYVVDRAGKVYAKATKQVGVKDTSETGSRDLLRSGVRQIVAETISGAGLTTADIEMVLSSGMITSEIGLKEISHAVAPCSIQRLADSMVRADDTGIIDGVPVWFVRGIKNSLKDSDAYPPSIVGEVDFMRGEETQVAGMLLRSEFKVPGIVVVLSSHTKFISLDESGITGSLTTMSGQIYDSIVNHTFLGKSIRSDASIPKPEGYFDTEVIDSAIDWVYRVGLIRSLMFPRFLDVILKTKWYERALFLEATVAADDLRALAQYTLPSGGASTCFTLVGKEGRCKVYQYLLRKMLPEASIGYLSDTETIDSLSINGILNIAEKAGKI